MGPSEAPPWFVVRVEGRWSLSRVGTDELVDVDLPGVLGVLGPHQGTPGVADGPWPRLVASSAGVWETWAWAGLVDAGAVAIEAPDGTRHGLDATDLVVLDAVGRAESPRAAAAVLGADLASVLGRLDRLAALGKVRWDARTPPDDVRPSTAPAVEVVARRAVADGATPAAGEPVASAWDAGPLDDARTPPTPGATTTALLGFEADGDIDVDEARHPADRGPEGRIPVYAVWHRHVGPLLSLGLLTAAARRHRGGSLTQDYEIRRPEEASSFLAHVASHPGPGVVLLSDYVWSLEVNLAVAREAKRRNPELVFIHGGPSCPAYEGDAARFLIDHGDVADLLVRGEGEEAVCDILERLLSVGPDGQRCLRTDRRAWRDIEGATFRAGEEAVRTPDRPRIANLDDLPSPYLTHEFDHIDPASWNYCLPVETTRGCPYGCTFCDWGSDTMSRIRTFAADRVTAEIDWAAGRGTVAINLSDANFGIMRRDVETTRRVAEAKARTGFPHVLVFYPAKNTTKHLIAIMDVLGEADIYSAASLSLQTTDPATLEALDRSNISTEHFIALAADHRRRRHPLQGDLLLGIPGQTYETYRRDLQFMFDHEILVRTWPVQVLPNAPMNAPEYKREHGLEVGDDNLVVGAASFGSAERAQMVRLRKIDITLERMGLARHLLRWLQWDHGIEATTVMDHIRRTTDADPQRFPVLTWVVDCFDLVAVAPIGWRSFYADLRRFVLEELGVAPSSALDCVIDLQIALMPQPGRTFPSVSWLAHDYLAYYRGAIRSLYVSGAATGPVQPLAAYGPASFEITGDPLDLCTFGVRPGGDPRSETMQGDFVVGSSVAYELASPLMRLLPYVGARGIKPTPFDEDELAELASEAEGWERRHPVRVALGRRRPVTEAVAGPGS